MLKPYRKKPKRTVVAVQVNLDTDGFKYRKWGDVQSCKAGDWLVENNGDVYTVNKDVFSSTYTQLNRGVYFKSITVWAEQATNRGAVKTLEGKTHYQSGDYIVYNNKDRTDGYAVKKETFESMYQSLASVSSD